MPKFPAATFKKPYSITMTSAKSAMVRIEGVYINFDHITYRKDSIKFYNRGAVVAVVNRAYHPNLLHYINYYFATPTSNYMVTKEEDQDLISQV